jgi:hypothetical protein
MAREQVDQRRDLRAATDAGEHDWRSIAPPRFDANRRGAEQAVEPRSRDVYVGDVADRNLVGKGARIENQAEVGERVADAARAQQRMAGAAAPQQPLPGQREVDATTAY